MRQETHPHELSVDRRYRSSIFNRLAVGSIITLWGTLIALKELGILQRDISTWPFAFISFGAVLIAGAIYRLYALEKQNKE